MASGTSTCARARSNLAGRNGFERVSAYLGRPTEWPARPVILLALTTAALGVITPLIPTSLTAAILIMAGAVLAVLSSGLNLAATARTTESATTLSPASPASPKPISNLRHALPTADPDWADLMARVNHELRTPLNAVIGFSEVMALEMYGPLGSERYQDYVSHIRESAGDLLKSAEDTLALTTLLSTPQKGPPRLVPCSLEHAVHDAWQFVRGKSDAGDVPFALTLPYDIEVLSEPRALRQILVNLMSEAIARCAPGEKIDFMAVVDEELIEIVVSTGPAKGQPRASGSLSMCVARTLLEMQGTSLLEIDTASGWRVVTVLDRAVQPDFFSAEDHRGSRVDYGHRSPVAVAA